MLKYWREHESFVLRALRNPEILRIYEPWKPMALQLQAHIADLYEQHKFGLDTVESVELLYNMHKLTTSQNAVAIGLDGLSPWTPFQLCTWIKRYAIKSVVKNKPFWDGCKCMPIVALVSRGGVVTRKGWQGAYSNANTKKEKGELQWLGVIFAEQSLVTKHFARYSIYHEYGHVFDAKHDIIKSPEFLKIYNAFAERVKAHGAKYYLNVANQIINEIKPHLTDTNFDGSQYDKTNLDVMMLMDFVSAIIPTPHRDIYGGFTKGHDKEYYCEPRYRHMEFFANMVATHFTNGGNPVLTNCDPELSEAIKEYVGDLWR